MTQTTSHRLRLRKMIRSFLKYLRSISQTINSANELLRDRPNFFFDLVNTCLKERIKEKAKAERREGKKEEKKETI